MHHACVALLLLLWRWRLHCVAAAVLGVMGHQMFIQVICVWSLTHHTGMPSTCAPSARSREAVAEPGARGLGPIDKGLLPSRRWAMPAAAPTGPLPPLTPTPNACCGPRAQRTTSAHHSKLRLYVCFETCAGLFECLPAGHGRHLLHQLGPRVPQLHHAPGLQVMPHHSRHGIPHARGRPEVGLQQRCVVHTCMRACARCFAAPCSHDACMWLL